MATSTAIDVVMPQMGVSVSEGTIVKWLKNEGEPIEADEALLEISTDKVDTEVPSPGTGIVQKILVQEGETVDVGTKLAVIAPDGAAPAAEEPVPEPAGPMTASFVPTSTVSPSGTRIWRRTPEPGLGTSVSTLSVEISSSVSSAWTVSPTCFDHLVIVPSETETPICGMTTSTAVPVAISSPPGR